MRPIERRPPTHTLHIEVPLHLDERERPEFDAIADSIKLALSISRAAVGGIVCDIPEVRLEKVAT